MNTRYEAVAEPKPNPINLRLEVALAWIPPLVALAATAHLCWAAMLAPPSMPDWWLGFAIASTVAAGVGLLVSGFIGRLRREIRGVVLTFGIVLLSCIMLAPAFAGSAMLVRGVAVECTVTSTYMKEHRGEVYNVLVLDCPGWYTAEWSTDPSDGYTAGDRLTGWFDPEGRVHETFERDDWSGTVLWSLGSLVAALAAVLIRLYTVADGHLKARLMGETRTG